MILHDNYFFSIDDIDSQSIVRSHSPLFHSFLTLIIGLCGVFLSTIAFLRLIFIFLQRQQMKKFEHLLNHRKYHFLLIFNINSLCISFLCLISCIDERFFIQSIIARFHFCSLHIFLWKFSLHFIPLLIIFILLRYHYFFDQKFRLKRFRTTTSNQILCTKLSLIIPFVLALSWSIDGLWLWGTTDMKNFVASSTINSTHVNSSSLHSTSGQTLICYLLINDDLNLTRRLLFFVQIDYILLFILHLFGFFLEVFLHIRLSCCLIAHHLTRSFLREQQMSVYILYYLIGFTLTSLPFYFYRACEILFDPYQSDLINSSIFAQLLLFGNSCQLILYALLSLPSRYFLRLKCYTFVHRIPNHLFDDHRSSSTPTTTTTTATIPSGEPRRKYRSIHLYHHVDSNVSNGFLKTRSLSTCVDHCSRKSSMLVEISEDSVSS